MEAVGTMAAEIQHRPVRGNVGHACANGKATQRQEPGLKTLVVCRRRGPNRLSKDAAVVR